MMIDKTKMTVADLVAALYSAPSQAHPDEVREVLPKILYAAGSFYDGRDAADGYACALCWTLCLAASLVRADCINEKVADEIIAGLGAIAGFALEANGLSLATRVRLEQIEDAAEPMGEVMRSGLNELEAEGGS